MTRVLLVGESWVSLSTHVKGFNSFVTGGYETGLGWFKGAMDAEGVELAHMPSHLASSDFPFEAEDINYDCLILSDVGADTFLLHPRTWLRGERTPNRLQTIAEYVRGGGGLIMAGGYMSFQGINGAAMYQRSPLAEALPVKLMATDDRCERPEGVEPAVVARHPVVEGLPKRWPHILGYNLVKAKKGSTVVATVDGDPLLVVGEHGRGRAIAFTTDIGPHWCPAGFAEWDGYRRLWGGMIRWAAGQT